MTVLEISAWLRAQGMRIERIVDTREDIFRLVASEVGDLPVLYLEFGVRRGVATRLWSHALTHPDAVLHGFDSFEGNPEPWGGQPRGAFSTGGVVPVIDDPRVRFYKGWFDQVLPTYVPPERDQVVLIMDADLYSSTTYVLSRLEKLVRSGTFIYFDEFRVDQHEFRAFREFVDSIGRRFRLRASTPDLNRLVFQCVGASPAHRAS